MKRFLSLILAALILSASFTACSEATTNDDGQGGETETAQSASETVVETEEETEKYIDDLPDTMDFGGTSVKFIVEDDNATGLGKLSVYAEEDTGDVIDSAIVQRNSTVSERLNIVIELLESYNGGNNISSILQKGVASGACDFDIMSVYQYYGIGIATSGNVYNMANLPNVDFSREYWGTDYIDNMSYKGAIYWATGDIALKYTGGVYCTYINDEVWNNNYPEENIYDIVNEGKWTLDKLTEYAETVYTDTNGNMEKDAEDIYGFIINYEDPIDGMAAACGVEYSQRDENGVPYITIENEHTINVYEKLYKLIDANPNVYISNSDGGGTQTMQMFNNGKAMIVVQKLYHAGIFLRDMEDSYKVVPAPKYDENQEYYMTMLHDSVNCYGLPVTNTNYELMGATLEAMASESYKVVSPAYYEKALKYKYVRDSESGQMIELIREHVTADFAALYSNSIANIVHFFREQLSSGTENISSVFAKKEKVWNKALSKLLTGLEESAG